MTYRVIQWATGATGSHAVRAIAAHPDLELVGALVYSDEKAGRDIGELVGIGPIGVIATKDPEQTIANERRSRPIGQPADRR